MAPDIDDAEVLDNWIQERNQDLADRLPVSSEHEYGISIEITGDIYDYRVTIAANRDGVPVAPGGVEFSCECSTSMLLERIDEGITVAVEHFHVAPAQLPTIHPKKTGAPSGEPSDDGDAVRRAATKARIDRNLKLGPFGYIGVGEGVLGVGALAAGVALILREPGDIRERSERAFVRTTEEPGFMLTLGGGIALLSGIVLVTTDVILQRRRRRHSIALTPTDGANSASGVSGATVSFSGRF
ncbi:MAG: hypothetical protein AAGF11_38175 [Myxococcota bacterium]